jgi:23S rRNA pseudouridine955/2504/2580 synthase
VHAAYTGHPVAGDERYGDRGFNAECQALGLKRMFLHAQLIEFVWPDSGEEFVVSAPLPLELNEFLNSAERVESRGTKRIGEPDQR